MAQNPLAGEQPTTQNPLAGEQPTTQNPLASDEQEGTDGSVDTDGSVRPELLDVLDRLAEREGVNRAAVCVAFVLAHPAGPVAIVGTQRVERLEALQAALRVRLDRNDVYDVIEASQGAPLP